MVVCGCGWFLVVVCDLAGFGGVLCGLFAARCCVSGWIWDCVDVCG